MREWIRRNLLTVLMSAGMIIGISLLLYPSVANYWNSFHQARTIMDYSEVVSSMNKDDYKKLLDEARAYNEKLAETGFKWTMTDAERQEYMRQLKVEGTDAMGYISIPKLHIKLPLMHGTDEKILQTSIGHLEETSLPVGGKGSHCVVSGHRGLPSSRLFTDIDKMKEGDTWTITVLNETLTYECDQVRIVLPEDLSNIKLEKDKDLCTLVTCTPYVINTHRLLVRGHRVPNANGTANITADAIQIEPKYIAPFLAVPVLLILLILLLITTRKANRIDPEEIITEYLTGKGLKK
jgi:sortase A